MEQEEEEKKQSWLGREVCRLTLIRFVINHCAGCGGTTAFATIFAASTAIRSNDLNMTRGLRLVVVRELVSSHELKGWVSLVSYFRVMAESVVRLSKIKGAHLIHHHYISPMCPAC